MWVFFAIRLESRTRTSYLIGHNRWVPGPQGATIVNLAAWPSAQNGVYFYNAFVANITDREQFRLIVQGGDSSRGINNNATDGGGGSGQGSVTSTAEDNIEDQAAMADPEAGEESRGCADHPEGEGSSDSTSRGVKARKLQ